MSSSRVAVAAPHPAALDAAAEVVGAGGSAVDAATAAAAALAVVYPHQCAVGGDLIAVVRPGGIEGCRAVISAGAAAGSIDVDALRAASARMPAEGPLSVTVPGAVAGWRELSRRWGRLPLADLLRSAIGLARDGAEVSPGLARSISHRAAAIDADAGLSALLRPGGRPLVEGNRIVQPALAETLESIAADPDGFYAGELGSRIANGLAGLGSPVGTDDLTAHKVEVTDPLQVEVDGARWSVAPPPSQGAALLATLLGAGRSPADLVRSARTAELRRDAFLGDPRGGPVDVQALLGRGGDPAGLPGGAKPAGDTVAVTAVDADGAAVSLIMSVFQTFGSGLLDPRTGVLFHNRGSAFSLDPAHPGVVRPGARPPHTLCPAIVESDGATVALGCQGGRAQAWILAQVAAEISTTADPAGLLGRPRWVIGSRDLGMDAPAMKLEPGVPEEAAEAAEALGLTVHRWSRLEDDAGHVQVARLRHGVLDAASDPRADGRGAVL